MNKRLQILYLEDEPDFADLVRSLIEEDNLDGEIKHVQTRAELEAALDSGTFDVMLSDFHLPSFTGLEALAIVKKKYPDMPFILISGTIGEQAAIESLKAGATDYLLKQQPERLASAIRRAVHEAEERVKLRQAETERRAAEVALRDSETLFRSVWENSADGMRLTDENGTIVVVNGAFCKLVGLSQSKLKGKHFTVVYAEPKERGKLLERYHAHFRGRHIERKREHSIKLHNGREAVFEITESLVVLRDKPLLLLSLFRDVTTQRHLETQLRQSQKMKAIGQLAGGIAHDFNNILTVIHGHASMLLASNLDKLAAHSAQQIRQAADRAAKLTRQLLTFSRRQPMQPKRLNINEIIENMSDTLGRLLGEDVSLHLNYSQLPALIKADAGMMEQVILTLAVNARDAMPRGGQLTVSVAIADVDTAHVQRHAEARVGRFVCVSKSDTGRGIPPENLPRLFEPFFTTKELGKGTGLGLAAVYGIVKQHEGWIEVESTVGKGSTFRFYIPYVGLPEPEEGR